MILILEGNIGSGKSTLMEPISDLLARLVGKSRVSVVHEPVSEWCNGGNVLKCFYEDPTKYGLQFQATAMFNMLENERLAVRLSREGKWVLMERSLWYSSRVFGELLLQWQKIPDTDKQIYRSLQLRYAPEIGGRDGYTDYYRLWVRTPVDMCFERIMTRGRPGEELITKKYLTDIENLTSSCFTAEEFEAKRSVVLDGTYDKDQPMRAVVDSAASELPAMKMHLQDFLQNLVAKQGGCDGSTT